MLLFILSIFCIFVFSEHKLIIEDCQEVVRNLLQENLTDSLFEYTQELAVLSYAINSILENNSIQFDLVCFISIMFYLF